MKAFRNEKGIVLVTSLMLTLIILIVISGLLYMMTAGTKISGAQKRYRTALEASYGGAEIVAKDIVPFILRNYSSGSSLSHSLDGLVGTSGIYSGVQMKFPSNNPNAQMCLQEKLRKSTGSWPAVCLDALPPAKMADLTLQLQSSGGSPFTVYTKIVSTRVGNSDMSGFNLIGGGVAESNNIVYPQSQPYLYTIEVQGQRAGDASISSDLEVLYAY